MANNFHTPEAVHDATSVLETLRTDRAKLAEHLRPPRYLAPAFGLVAALYVAIPAAPSDTLRRTMFVGALTAGVALVSGFHSFTGIRISRIGARAQAAVVVAVVASLTLLSVSYGLAASGLQEWIVATAAAGFALVSWLTRRIVAAARDHVRRDS